MYLCQEILATSLLRFLISVCCSVVLLEDSVVSKFTVSVLSSNRRYFLDDDGECLFQTDEWAQSPLTVRLTKTSLFVQTFLVVFFSISPICFLPINSPYTIILTAIDTVKIKHFFVGKKNSRSVLFP